MIVEGCVDGVIVPGMGLFS